MKKKLESNNILISILCYAFFPFSLQGLVQTTKKMLFPGFAFEAPLEMCLFPHNHKFFYHRTDAPLEEHQHQGSKAT